jgi:hypothetical protein
LCEAFYQRASSVNGYSEPFIGASSDWVLT